MGKLVATRVYVQNMSRLIRPSLGQLERPVGHRRLDATHQLSEPIQVLRPEMEQNRGLLWDSGSSSN